jgi:dihydroneopterin aldolase
MKDTMFVEGLVIHAHHGVMKHEAQVGQRFAIDLLLEIDLSDASRSDKLADTVSYATVVDVASRAFTARTFRLVEAAAGAVADAVLRELPAVQSVRVTVHKPHAPIPAIFSDVGVTIGRSRRR